MFETFIEINSVKMHYTTDVISIKCQAAGKVALLYKFLLQSADKMEAHGQDKFVSAGLANVIWTEMKTNIIQNNNKYLQTMTTIPINGLPPLALTTEIIIDDEADIADQEKWLS